MEKSPVDEHYQAAWDELTGPEGPFAWSVQEVRGVPTRVYDQAPPNMALVWAASIAYAENEYLIYGEERMTYGQAHTQVDALASYLTSVGVGHGDRVALSMRNYPEWALAYWATLKIGAAVVGMNAWWTGAEMEFGLADSAPKALIVDEERLKRVEPELEGLRKNISLHVIGVRVQGELPENSIHWEDAIEKASELPSAPEIDISPEDDVCIFYTSGTTGRPKGAALTHRGAVSNLLNLGFWNAMTVTAGMKAVAAGETPAGADKQAGESNPGSVLAVPLFHVTGCNCCLHPVTAQGGRLILMYRWDAGVALELIEKERPSTFTGVPTMARELINHPDFETRDTSSLSHLGGGGAAVQPDLVHKIEKKIDGRPSTGYGLTEVNGVIAMNSAHFFTAKPESTGPVVPILESRIVSEDGEDQEAGQLGELWVRGGNVFRGYLNRPEANEEILTDGWFHTGDIGYLDDDGFLFLVDRAKDMVLRGGENVYSAEVEAAIYEHPSVAEAAVFAVPDERLGEAVGVAIVKLPGAQLTAEELQNHVRTLIASFKVPEHIWFSEEPLPRNANGKFLKRELRETLIDIPTE
ncbi:MAG: class I adenylate-forming enzyme family protein [Actinomycetota bacterium]|nr:class I adenylate-forming enzyme family protein [Actinomycetota bacterium]